MQRLWFPILLLLTPCAAVTAQPEVRRVLDELRDTTPLPDRLVELALDASRFRDPQARLLTLGAFTKLEERIRAGESVPMDDAAEATALAARLELSPLQLTTRQLQSLQVAVVIVELGPHVGVDALAYELRSEVELRQLAALHVARIDRSALVELIDPIAAVFAAASSQHRKRYTGPRGLSRTSTPPSVFVDRVSCLAARSLVEVGADPTRRHAALEHLLDLGMVEDRLFALRAMALEGAPSRLLRYRVIRLLAARTADDEELCAALLTLSVSGLPPRDEWPPPRATLLRWMRSAASTPEQKAVARELLGWRGPTDADALEVVQRLAEDERHPKAAAIAVRVAAAWQQEDDR